MSGVCGGVEQADHWPDLTYLTRLSSKGRCKALSSVNITEEKAGEVGIYLASSMCKVLCWEL